MIVGSTKENTTLEKRVSLTPESAKNIIGLGLKVCVEKGYAIHLGINDNEYKEIGVEIKTSSKEVLNSSDLITKVNCPSEDEIEILKDNTIIIGMLNPSKNKNQIDKIIDKKIKVSSLPKEAQSSVKEILKRKEPPTTKKMYKVGLTPKPDDMLNYQTTFADQPKKVQDALKAIGYEVEKNLVGQKKPKSQIDLAMRRPMPMILDSLKGRIIEDIRSGKQEPGRADKILSEKLLEQGVPGVKYRAAGSRGASIDAADVKMNYVIFDDKAIKILEKYGIVGPVAITALGAAKQEGADDGNI